MPIFGFGFVFGGVCVCLSALVRQNGEGEEKGEKARRRKEKGERGGEGATEEEGGGEGNDMYAKY